MGAEENNGVSKLNETEVKAVRKEAAKQTLLEILSQEFNLEDFFSDLPEPATVLNIIKNKTNLNQDAATIMRYDDVYSIDKEKIGEIIDAVALSQGKNISVSVKETIKHLKGLSLLKKMYDEKEDLFEKLEPVHSKLFAEALMALEEQYVSGKNWKKSESILVVAEDFVKKVTGVVKPRLYATMDADWGIYLWKCGDYAESEKKLKKANAGIQELIKKHGTEIQKEEEIEQNSYLYARILHGFGTLYGDFLEDKAQAIEYNKKCIEQLKKIQKTQKNYKAQRMETSVLNNMGVAYHKMAENFPEKSAEYLIEAVNCYESSIELSRELNHKRMTGWLLFNAGEVYALLGNFEKAESCSAESRKIYTEDFPSERGISGVEMLDAVINLQKGDYKTALEYINKSLEIREKLNEPRRIADALECRGDIYLEMDEKTKAITDYQSASLIYVSICAQDKIKKLKDKLELLSSFDSQ